MNYRHVLISSLALAASALGCSSPAKDSNDEASGGTATSGGGTSNSGSGGSAGEATVGGAGGSGGSGGAGGSAGASAGGSGGAGGAPSGIDSCSTGTLFEGDPLYNDKPDAGDPNPDGQGLLDDPPIRNEAVAVIGDHVFVETEQEIWVTDLSQNPPKISRMAGQEDAGYVEAGLACADTRFLVIRDMVATADGKLVIMDYVGGAVIEITDPAGANCQSHWVAGTHAKTDDPGADYPLAHGDQDGPGAQALFGGTEPNGAGIHKVATDAKGNIYTWDEGTGKFKKIATDSDRTVSTIGLGSADDNVMSLAWLGGKLYASGVDGTNDFLLEVDPAAYDAAAPQANVHEVFRNRGEQFPEIDGTGSQAIPGQLVSDGEALIVSGQSGYVWRMAPDGTVLATLAGTGAYLDYQGGFDPLVPHPASEWQLVSSLSNADGGPWLALGAGKLYWSGGIGIGKYMLQFSCP